MGWGAIYRRGELIDIIITPAGSRFVRWCTEASSFLSFRTLQLLSPGWRWASTYEWYVNDMHTKKCSVVAEVGLEMNAAKFR